MWVRWAEQQKDEEKKLIYLNFYVLLQVWWCYNQVGAPSKGKRGEGWWWQQTALTMQCPVPSHCPSDGRYQYYLIICPTPIISLNLYLWLVIPLHSSLTETYLFSDWIIHLTATIKRNWFPQAIYLMHFIVHLNTVTFASFVLQFWHFRYIMTQ